MMAQALAPPPPEPQQLSLADLRAVSMLGRGAKGVVFHVVPEGEGGAGDVAMALKSVSREAARHKKSGGSGGGYGHRRIWFERDVLLALRHPLLPALRGVLATRCRLRDRPLRRRRPQLPPTPPDREDVLRLRHTPQQTLLRITTLLGKKYT